MTSGSLVRMLLAAMVILAAVPIGWYWLARDGALSAYFASVLLAHIAALCALSIALALIWKAWDAPGSRALCLFLLAFGFYNGSVALSGAYRILLPGYAGTAYDLTQAFAIGGGLGALVSFSATFPGVLGSVEWTGAGRRWWSLLARFRRKAASLAVTLGAGSMVACCLAIDAIFFQPASYVGARQLLIELALVAGFGAASLNLWVAYRALGEGDRARIVWVAEGVVLLGLGVTAPLALKLSMSAAGAELPPTIDWYVWAFSEIGFVGCLAFAVFGRGAVDSALVFRRTTIAGGFAILALFLFSGIENLVTEFLVARLGLPDTLGTWVAGGFVALAFTPAYRWAEKRRRAHVAPPVSEFGGNSTL